MKASVGRIVHYTLTEQNARDINKRRADAQVSDISRDESGAQVHVGNNVRPGDVFPLVITRVWDDNSVNGQVLLDGNDTLWVTSIHQWGSSETPLENIGRVGGFFAEPPRV